MLQVLNYTGAGNDRGGVMSVVHALASAGRFECHLGVGPGFNQRRSPPLNCVVFPAMPHESINPVTLVKGLAIAKQARAWLRADPKRIFHGRSRAGLIAVLWLRLLGEKRIVSTVHSLGRRTWFYRMASAILGTRLIWLGPSMKRHYGIPDRSWSGCIPDCVPLSAWTSRRPAFKEGGRFRVGCAGSIVEVKQWELVLEALALISAPVSVTVIFAGDTDGTQASIEYGERLKALAARLGVAGQVTWLGEVGDMREFYESVDCLVSASRWEASSMAALEAACAGLPLVASDASGTRDLIELARLGRLFKAGDTASLAAELTELATCGEGFGAERDEAALLGFAAPAIADRHFALYQRLIQGD